MTLDEHYENNKKIIKSIDEFIKERGGTTGIYRWQQEITSLNDGEYQKVGLLDLPFAVEFFDDGLGFYTFFNQKFFRGEGVIDPEAPEFGKCIDPESFNNYFEQKKSEVHDIRVNRDDYDILDGIQNLVQKYFSLRKEVATEIPNIRDDDLTKESRSLVLGAFTKYE